MKAIFVLNDALSRTAVIHQAHSTKAYLSARLLESQLAHFSDKGWQQTQALIAKGELAVAGLFVDKIERREFNAVRIDGILKRGVFPASYVAMNTWIDQVGMEEVFAFYEQQAITGNTYLLHTVSILLSYKTLWPNLSAEQQPYFIERFTEFVTTTYYNNNSHRYPSKANASCQDISVENAIEQALKVPGFWGHNLICLSWLLQTQESNSLEFNHKVLGFIIEQTTWEFPDEDDNLDNTRMSLIEASTDRDMFYKSIEELFYGSLRNIHQVTLAAALVDLWQRASSLEIKQRLHGICQYFSE